jgi:hypothetical protein
LLDLWNEIEPGIARHLLDLGEMGWSKLLRDARMTLFYGFDAYGKRHGLRPFGAKWLYQSKMISQDNV